MEIFMILLGIVGIVVNANGWFIIPSLAIKVCFMVGGFIIGFKLTCMFHTQRIFKKIWK
jgi:hypothetical protein